MHFIKDCQQFYNYTSYRILSVLGGTGVEIASLGKSNTFYNNLYSTVKTVGETGVSWHMGFVGTLSFSLSANYDFTKEYHLYKGTNNTHIYTPYRFQSCSTNTVGINQLCLIFHLLSKFFSFQKVHFTTNDCRLWWLVSGYLTLVYHHRLQTKVKKICYCWP